MGIVTIRSTGIILKLTSQRSKVRISDSNGNPTSKPSAEGRYSDSYFIEWMISNKQVVKLAKLFLSKKDIGKIKVKIIKIKNFLRDSKYFQRKAVSKKKINTKFCSFNVYRYKENFYSIEKNTNSNTILKIAPKMGDYTLAPHLFVLFNFKSKSIDVFNNGGKLKKGDLLGSGARARWNPNTKQITSIIHALAHASRNHRDDLIKLLSKLLS